MKVKLREGQESTFLEAGRAYDVISVQGDHVRIHVPIAGYSMVYSLKRFDFVEEQPACLFEIGKCYLTRQGTIRRIAEIDFEKGKIRVDEWDEVAWVKGSNFLRNLKGEWVGRNGASAGKYYGFDLLPRVVATPTEGKVGTAQGAASRAAEKCLEDPSVLRDREHKATPLPARTPFDHFPDLKGWRVSSYQDGVGFTEWLK